jgi:hypothetical protein
MSRPGAFPDTGFNEAGAALAILVDLRL